jgi:hypothetical protein
MRHPWFFFLMQQGLITSDLDEYWTTSLLKYPPWTKSCTKLDSVPGIHILVILFDLPPGKHPLETPPMGLELSIVPSWWLALTRHLGRRKTVADSPIWSEARGTWLCLELRAPIQSQPALLRHEVKKSGSRAQQCRSETGICGGKAEAPNKNYRRLSVPKRPTGAWA